MSASNRARVCTLGTQEDMVRLCRTLLDNCQWFDEPEEDKPDLTLEQLQLLNRPYISVRIAVKEDAPHQGGINLFGEHFGDHKQAIVLRLDCMNHP